MQAIRQLSKAVTQAGYIKQASEASEHFQAEGISGVQHIVC
jgi:hypothetical protein